MNPKLAHYISVFGNPLLTIPLYAVIALFMTEKPATAWLVSLLLLGGIVAPLLIKSYRGVKKGAYTNYDISDREQRQSWYLLPTLLLTVVTTIMYATDQSRILRLAMLFALLLFIAAQLANLYIKVSLHVGFNAYLGFLIFPLSNKLGMGVLIFTLLLAWSRIVLKRHTWAEVISGAILGAAAGGGFLWMLNR